MGDFLSSYGGFILTWVIMLLASYLIGSLSFAVLVSRLMGLEDPRTFGSKNPGATNVLRTGNKRGCSGHPFDGCLQGVVARCDLQIVLGELLWHTLLVFQCVGHDNERDAGSYGLVGRRVHRFICFFGAFVARLFCLQRWQRRCDSCWRSLWF